RFSVCPKRPVNLSYSPPRFNGFFCVSDGFSVLTLWSFRHGPFTPLSSFRAPGCGGVGGQELACCLTSAAFAKEAAALGRRVQKAVDAGDKSSAAVRPILAASAAGGGAVDQHD